MLRTGIILLFTSSAGVTFRMADISYSDIPGLQWVCLAGLCGSLVSFAAVYLKCEMPYLWKETQRPESFRSTAWKIQTQE